MNKIRIVYIDGRFADFFNVVESRPGDILTDAPAYVKQDYVQESSSGDRHVVAETHVATAQIRSFTLSTTTPKENA